MGKENRLLIDVKFDETGKFAQLNKQITSHELIDWEDVENRPQDLSGITYALCWKPDAGLLSKLPDLKVVFSAGAGVDHILCDESLPQVPLVRFVDESLTTRMSEWVCMQCLMHLRHQRLFDAQQRNRLWKGVSPQCEAKGVRVGIMGLGVLGQDSARKLAMLGFKVNGWSRTKKTIDGVECFDVSQTDAFLASSDILVGLLPHTAETTGIFNTSLFKKLAADGPLGGPIFINAGRGKSQNENELVQCLKDGTLSAASLDVFEKEPLEKTSPLWGMDNVIVTPHMASVTDITVLGKFVATQINRFEEGLALEHVVDRDLGY